MSTKNDFFQILVSVATLSRIEKTQTQNPTEIGYENLTFFVLFASFIDYSFNFVLFI